MQNLQIQTGIRDLLFEVENVLGKSGSFLSTVTRLVTTIIVISAVPIPWWPGPWRPYSKPFFVDLETCVNGSIHCLFGEICWVERNEKPFQNRLIQVCDGFLVVIFLRMTQRQVDSAEVKLPLMGDLTMVDRTVKSSCSGLHPRHLQSLSRRVH